MRNQYFGEKKRKGALVHARSPFNHLPQIGILSIVFINSNNVNISAPPGVRKETTYTAAICASDGVMNVSQNMDFQCT
jgi:hypothetical protein